MSEYTKKVLVNINYKLALILALFFITPYFLSGSLIIPVQNATQADWHKDTFWYEPWGISGVHKGIDIFAKTGTPVISPSAGVVVFTGEINIGGKVVVTLGPNWRIHYLAHLDTIDTHIGDVVSAGDVVGTVGDSGNAKGKQPHLHYSHLTLLPYIWRVDSTTQGWKKMFYLNPVDYFHFQ